MQITPSHEVPEQNFQFVPVPLLRVNCIFKALRLLAFPGHLRL